MTQDNKKADTRDHGGGIDAAIAYYGGARNDWIDLSTGINPNPIHCQFSKLSLDTIARPRSI